MKKPHSQRIKESVKVNPATGCWEWQRGIEHTGYGATSYRQKRMSAHRVAWLVFHPEDEERLWSNPKLFVCHKCDNKLCCNPDHLFLGTPKDNTDDFMQKRGPAWVAWMEKRKFQRLRKFSHETIDAIRVSKEPLREVCRRYGVSQGYASNIRNGKYKTGPRKHCSEPIKNNPRPLELSRSEAKPYTRAVQMHEAPD